MAPTLSRLQDLLSRPATQIATDAVFTILRDLGDQRDHIGLDFNQVADWVSKLDGYHTPRDYFTPTDYHTFNDWFLRELSPKSRVLMRHNAQQAPLSSPVEARVLQVGDIDGGRIQLKWDRADVEAALQPMVPDRDVGAFTFVKFGLLKCHYHRVHAPITGRVVAMEVFDRDTDPFGKDIATVLCLDTDHGRVFVCAVGEHTVQGFVPIVKVGDTVQKTDELGHFWWGSMVLVVFPPTLSPVIPGHGEYAFPGDPIASADWDMDRAVRRVAAVTTIDPKWVKGLRAWVKKTFTPKSSYKSTQEISDHLKHLRDVDLERLWQYLFYTKGLLPRDDVGKDSIINRLKLKLADELKAARELLAEANDPIAFSIEAMTPGTRASQYRPDIREFYERINPADPETAMRLGFEDRAKEFIPKVEAILSGKLLRAVSAFLEKYADDTPFEQEEILLEYDVGNVKLVYDGKPDPRVFNAPEARSPRGLDEYIPYFRDAKALLDRRGFGKLWYGPIFVACPSCGGTNPHGAHFGVGAHYLPGKDQVVVFLDPKPFMVELLIHELGHRYYYEFMDQGDRARFDSYFGDVKAVSSYGSSSSSEDFAEVFAHFVLGRDMSRDQIDRFKAFLAKKDRTRFSAERVAHRYASGVSSAVSGGKLVVTLPANVVVLRDVLAALGKLGLGGKIIVQSRDEFDSADGHIFSQELPLAGVARSGLNYIVTTVDGTPDKARPLSPTITLIVTP